MNEASIKLFKDALLGMDNVNAKDMAIITQMIEHAYLIGKTEKP